MVLKYLLIASVVYCVALLLLFMFQRALLYFPNKTYTPPQNSAAYHAIYHELPVKTEDGNALIAWVAPATTKPITLVFFHGNADNLNAAAYIGLPYIQAGYGFVMVEYRGYSGFGGNPTEAGLYADARVQLKALIRTGIKPESMVFFGHSLGTGVATQMATEFPAAGLILLAPYLSVAKMAQLRFPIFPAEWMTRDRFDNASKIARIAMPLLIAHGDKDKVIPHRQGTLLFAQAKEPKQFLTVRGAGHVAILQSVFLGESIAWLDKLTLQLQNNP